MSGINDVRFSEGEPKNREQARNIGADCKADSADHPTPSAPGARVKLTKAQTALLHEAAEGTHCVKAYRPASFLVASGLAEWACDDEWGGRLVATPAGRTALSEAGHE